MPDTCQPNHVNVTVAANGQPACDPHELKVTGKDVHLTFELETPGYVFLAERTVVVTPVSPPSHQFPHPSKTLPPQSTRATLFDCNTDSRDFSYTVYVKKVATGEVTRVDPTIINGDG